MKNAKVSGNMTRHVVTMNPDESLSKAYHFMQEYGFRHIPVVNREGRVQGILSDRDVFLAAKTTDMGAVEVPDLSLEEIMTRHPITCRENTNIANVAATMVDRKIDAMPVLDGMGQLTGMITSTDLISLLRDYDENLHRLKIPFDFIVCNTHQYAAGGVQ